MHFVRKGRCDSLHRVLCRPASLFSSQSPVILRMSSDQVERTRIWCNSRIAPSRRKEDAESSLSSRTPPTHRSSPTPPPSRLASPIVPCSGKEPKSRLRRSQWVWCWSGLLSSLLHVARASPQRPPHPHTAAPDTATRTLRPSIAPPPPLCPSGCRRHTSPPHCSRTTIAPSPTPSPSRSPPCPISLSPTAAKP